MNEYTGLKFRIEVKTGGGCKFGKQLRPVYYLLGLFLSMCPGLVKKELFMTEIIPQN